MLGTCGIAPAIEIPIGACWKIASQQAALERQLLLAFV